MTTSGSASNGGVAHILIIPFPAQGHIFPLLDLTHQLLLRVPGLTITILVTPKNLPTLNPLISKHPSIQTLVLPFPPHPSLPHGVENVKDIGNHGNDPIINALAKLHHPIVDWFSSHPSPPLAMISDFFMGWTHHLASQLGIPRVAFYSSGAFLTTVNNYLWTNADTMKNLAVVKFPDLPGTPSFSAEHLPSRFRSYRESEPESELIKDGILANSLSWGSVFNTFDALEGPYLEKLKKEMGHTRVWAVGPVNLSNGSGLKGESDPGLMKWLDGCPDGSVLYICFGSQKWLKRPHMEVLAIGLEASGTRFIWVVNSVATDGGVVPDGFEERVAGRGLVVRGWAPQVAILSHVAVGGFVSHCGWNSLLEGIVAGVIILAWPMEADQFVNARLLVDDMGVAVRLWEGENSVPDSDNLAKVIAETMGGNVAVKSRAKELRDKALGAVRPGGSSSRDLNELVTLLQELQG